jgi:hypothetical protein
MCAVNRSRGRRLQVDARRALPDGDAVLQVAATTFAWRWRYW